MDSVNFWGALLEIIAINLVLSGDNATVIAMAAARLAPEERRGAMLWGSLLGVVLRVGLIFVATRLLSQPYLQSLGGLVLLWVGFRLVVPGDDSDPNTEPRSDGRLAAIRLILMADLVMSLDNVLSLAAVAQGNLLLLVLGLLTSLPLILIGSATLIRLMHRYPFLVLLGGALLGEVAGRMILADRLWERQGWALPTLFTVLFPWVCAMTIGFIGWFKGPRQTS